MKFLQFYRGNNTEFDIQNQWKLDPWFFLFLVQYSEVYVFKLISSGEVQDQALL